MIAFMICTTVLDLFSFRDREEAYSVCEMVVLEAEIQKVDPALAVALCFHESGLRRFVVSKAGAVGPMQVLPRYYPKDFPTDTPGQIKAGVFFLKRYLARSKTEVDAIAKYNGGNRPGKRSYRWARVVVRLAYKLRGE
jgi:soluble lytic murein transglycosylase-like protein